MITDSFHGTAFAIMFNTQFVEVLPKEKITRNLSVLQQFGIEDRILREINDFSYIDKMIDFNVVNEKPLPVRAKPPPAWVWPMP